MYMFLVLMKKSLSTENKIELFFFMCYSVLLSDINDHNKHTKDVTMKRNLISCSNDSGYINQNK